VAEASDDAAVEALVADTAWVQAENVCAQTVVIGNLIHEAFLVLR